MPIPGCLCYRSDETEQDNPALVAVKEDYQGEDRVVLEETPVILLSYRGPCEDPGKQTEKLKQYAKENHLNVAGVPFLTFLDGPNASDSRSDLYLTQIMLPIAAPDNGSDDI